MQPSRSGWRNPPQSPHYMPGEDTKYFQSSFKAGEQGSRWPKVESTARSVSDDSKTYESSQDSPVKVKEEVLDEDQMSGSLSSPKSDHSPPVVLKMQLPLEDKQEDDWEATLSGKLLFS
ncbi:hypothetical protein JD844_013672 [Phrynosoma platyrhinos]|uniref:Uncharacterized protein n=1 Tax=Phrynosoma platyrhinos TaxID=52577 RepID=A0ABQ7TM56_PHRPL|nr:hypothetical protein JD844_013672 [Phrynosoma platyrhinos]